MMQFDITDVVAEQDKKTVIAGLSEHDLPKLEYRSPKDLAVYHRVNGEIKAGLIGITHGNWFRVDYLWVSEELRHTGIGSKLLRAAEEAAMARGCRFGFLNTFDFQAPNFYTKYGYREVFVLEQYPETGKRFYYVKDLV